MYLTDEVKTTLETREAEHQEALRKQRKIITQAAVFSDELIDDRLFAPAFEVLARFREAFRPFGLIGIDESVSVKDKYTDYPHLEYKWHAKIPPGDAQELFDAFLSCADENTALTAEYIHHSQTFRVGAISLVLHLGCELPYSYRDLLKQMGVIKVQHSGYAYESLSCGFL